MYLGQIEYPESILRGYRVKNDINTLVTHFENDVSFLPTYPYTVVLGQFYLS